MSASKTSRTIVLLHGWTLNPAVTEKWQPFIQLLKEAGFTVKFWPLPGLAQPPKQAMTLQDYTDWLNQQTNKLDSFVLLGHSFGGQLAVRFSRLHPEKIERLILVDSSGILDDSFVKVAKRLVFKTLAKAGKALTQSPNLRQLLYRFARETDYYEASPTQRQTMQNLLTDQIIDDLPHITAPTLVVWGENDRVTPLKIGKTLAAQIPQAQLRLIADARHTPLYTHPAETTAVIKTFLETA